MKTTSDVWENRGMYENNKTTLGVWKQPVMYENNLWFMKTALDVWKPCDVQYENNLWFMKNTSAFRKLLLVLTTTSFFYTTL